MSFKRIPAFVLLVAVILGGLGLFVLLPARAADSDKGFLADLISRVLSTPTSSVSVGAVEGALSSDATIRDVVVSDRNGPWLKLDRLRLVWTRSALFSGRLEVDKLEIGKLEMLRRPLPGDAPPSNEPLLPQLPVKVVVKAFDLQELALGEPVIGTAARIGASGLASLGDPSQGLVLGLDAKRLDAPGTFSVKLTFVPATNALQTRLLFDEPAGGLIAHLGDIPGLPPVRLALTGDGTLDRFEAKLDFAAGPSIGAEGKARLDRAGGERRLTLDLSSRIEGLLPPSIRPVFAGTTALKSAVRFVDDGAVAIDALSLTSRLAQLDVTGQYGADRTVALALRARAVPNDGGKVKANETELGALDLDAAVKGPITAPTVEARFAVADASLPYGRFDRFDATFTAKPNGSLAEQATTLTLDGSSHVRGLVLADAGLARAVGDRIDLALRGVAGTNGVVRFDTLRLAAPGGSIAYAGMLGRSTVDGTLALKLGDLGRLSKISGLSLAGAASLEAKLDGNPAQSRIGALIEGGATDLGTGLSAVDGVTGRRLSLSGRVETRPGSRLSVERLSLAGAHMSASLEGSIDPEASDLSATVRLPDLARADARLSGKASLDARLTGPLAHPAVTADGLVADALALGRPIPSIAVHLSGTDLLGVPGIEATLVGTVDGKPAHGSLSARKTAEGSLDLRTLDLGVGSVALKGALAFTASGLANGDLALTAGNLDDLSPLALMRLGGEATATLRLDTAEGRQSLHLSASGARVSAPQLSVNRFSARIDVEDAYSAPVIDADIAMDKAAIGGRRVSKVRIVSKGTPSRSDFIISADAEGFSLAGAGSLKPGSPILLDVTRFEAEREGRRIALKKPAALAFDATGLDIHTLVFGVDGGWVSVSGRAGRSLDLTLDAGAVPLAATRIIAPSLALAGTLDAHAHIAGTPQAPTGPWRLKVAGLSVAAMRASGLPTLGLVADGVFEGDRTRLSATLAIPKSGTVRAEGTVPLVPDAPLALRLGGQLEASLANVVLAPSGRSVAGRVALDLTASGSLRTPQLAGTLSLNDGTATDALQGIALRGISARLVARGKEITIERASATTRNGGTIAASGRISVDPAADFPAAIRITGRNAELISSPFLTAVADLDLDLGGAITRRPTLNGTVRLTTLEVDIAERLPTEVRPLDGIRHLNAPPSVRKRLERQARARRARGRRQPPPFDAALGLVISAPNRVFVRGRGLDAELGGELSVGGTLKAPTVTGSFDLRRGRFAIVAQRLDFTRGKVTFTGDLTPELDFVAQTQAGDVTAIITVSGSAAEPSFAFSSEPDLPQDEVLSRLLFAKASGSLSPFQALQLAQAAAQFSGAGDDAFERLRKSLGVDNLDIQYGANGPTVGVSRYVGNNLSVGVKTGTKPQDSGVSLGIDVTKRLKLQFEGTADGGASAGIGAELEY